MGDLTHPADEVPGGLWPGAPIVATQDDVTKAREALFEAALAWREAQDVGYPDDRERAGDVLADAVDDYEAALDRAERPRAVPTEPGEYYLEDGRPRVCRWPVGGQGWLLCDRPDTCIPDRADALTWATDPATGEVERVPRLEEWRDARDNLAHADQRWDYWRTRALELWDERDEARAELSAEAAYDELQELLSALAVPSHADPLVLVQAIRRVEAVARDWSDDANSRCLGTHNEALAEAVAALAALRTPPRALPTEDGPGVQFWGAWCGGDMRAVDVVMRRGERYGRTLGLGGLEWEPIDDERWTWLSTPDGKAVRCEPPEVTHD